jgi:hypothetical protein
MKRDRGATTGSDDAEALAESLIEVAGSKRKAHQLIEAALAKGAPGAPPGSRHPEDAKVLWAVQLLELKYRLQGRPVPDRSALISETLDDLKARGVDLCENSSKKAVKQRLADQVLVVPLMMRAGDTVLVEPQMTHGSIARLSSRVLQAVRAILAS